MKNKEKLLKLKSNQNFILICFSILIAIFYLFFTRLMIKTDDGNFLGITALSDYNIIDFLKYRYNNISGRTVGEFLMMFFINHNIIWWKILSTLIVIYIVWFWMKLSEMFKGTYSKNKKKIFCACGIFFMLVSCLNPSVFWFAGSFSYLWPFSFMLMTIAPLIFYIYSDKLDYKLLIVSFFASLIGTSQEQSAACCLCLYLILLIIIIVKKKFKVCLVFPLIPICTSIYFMLTSPGIKVRMVMEANNGFKRYSSMSIFDKLICGLSTYFANCYYLSVFLTLLFISLLSIMIYDISKNKKSKIMLITFNTIALLITVVLNVIVSIINKSLPHMILRKAFKTGNFDISSLLLFISGLIVLLLIVSLIIKLILCNKNLGLMVCLCFLASFCCGLVLSFSPSIFSSGQRTFFYSNMFIITACVILFSSINESKLTNKIFKTSIIYSTLSFLINCFAFIFFEHPLMG